MEALSSLHVPREWSTDPTTNECDTGGYEEDSRYLDTERAISLLHALAEQEYGKGVFPGSPADKTGKVSQAEVKQGGEENDLGGGSREQ